MPLPRAVLRPDGFHGERALRNRRGGRAFFEGWYVKLVSEDRRTRIALIPGVFRSEDARILEAFIQVLDGATGETAYHPMDMSRFQAAADRFAVAVGESRFSEPGISLELPGIRGEVAFGPFTRWPVTLRSPGAMGWYAWVPTMECYHGVVSLGHDLSGWLDLGSGPVDLGDGRGYIEKDWGTAFPEAYIWIHSNHFGHEGASLMASTAIIPWHRIPGHGAAFRGDLVGLHVPSGPAAGLHRFATYTGARTRSLDVDDESVLWELVARDGHRLVLEAAVGGRVTGLLHAPVRTQMHQRVAETLDGEVHVRLMDPAGRVVFSDIGAVAGIEVHGPMDRLLQTPGR